MAPYTLVLYCRLYKWQFFRTHCNYFQLNQKLNTQMSYGNSLICTMSVQWMNNRCEQHTAHPVNLRKKNAKLSKQPNLQYVFAPLSSLLWTVQACALFKCFVHRFEFVALFTQRKPLKADIDIWRVDKNNGLIYVALKTINTISSEAHNITTKIRLELERKKTLSQFVIFICWENRPEFYINL